MSAPEMAYLARAACGCTKVATIDRPEMADLNAEMIAECIRDGLTVERVTVEYVRENWRASCDVCKSAEDNH